MFAQRTQQQQHRTLKKGLDFDDSRRKRTDVTIELRKKNRDEQLLKRRMASMPQAKQTNDENSNILNTTEQFTNNFPKLTKSDINERLTNISQLVRGVNSNNPTERLAATVEFRRMLSVEDHPPIQDVINCGVVPRLMQFLSMSTEQKLQFEAAWTITNIASGSTSHTKCVVEHGGIQQFVQLLQSPNPEVQEQAVWALGNIAGDSPEYRDAVLSTNNSMQRLIDILNHPQEPKMTMIRNATWCMSNFCRGKPKPKFEQIKSCIPVLAKLVSKRDAEVLTDSCWALSYVTDDQTQGNQKIEAVIQQGGICSRLIYLLQHGSSQVQVPALRTIGNIVTGDDHQTQTMLECKPLPALAGMLSCQKKGLRKETCWTISNVTAGTSHQIQMVIDANLIPPLVNILKEDQFDVQKEAAWAISNIASGGSEDQTRFLVSQAALPALCGMLKCGDAKMIIVVLDALNNILKVGKKENSMEDNEYADIVEECGGLDTLEELQRHENEEVYEKSVKILQNYFESEEDDGMGMAPQVENGQFAFGATNGANSNANSSQAAGLFNF